MEWSKYQLTIFDAYENTNKNIVVEAAPGSGKTFTLKELCNRTKEGTSCLFMAFNKSIAEELKTKLPTTVECNTFHSMGLRTLMKNFRFRMQLEENKCFSLCMELFDFRKRSTKRKCDIILPYKNYGKRLGCRFVKSTKEMSLRFALNMIWIMKIQ